MPGKTLGVLAVAAQYKRAGYTVWRLSRALQRARPPMRWSPQRQRWGYVKA